MKMNQKIYRVAVKCSCFVIGVLCVAACQRPAGSTDTDEYRGALQKVDDSIAAQSPQARKMVEQGLKAAEDSFAFYEYYARMGKYFCLSATPDSMVPYIDKVIWFAKMQPESPRRNSLLAFAYNTQAANYHNFHKKGEEALALYQETYRLSLASDAKDQTPMVCANLGDAYLFENQLPEAASWYRRALFLVDSLDLPKKENITLYLGLATIYLQLNDFDTSLKYYQQTEKYFNQMSVAMQAYYLNNYGNYYYYSKDYKNSLRLFLRLKDLLEKRGKAEAFDMYLCKLNMADVYLNLDQLAESEKYLNEVEPYMRKNADGVATYYCNTIRIGLAVKRHDFQVVTRILNSEQNMSQMPFTMRQIRNHYLRLYYKARGDYRLAYENLREDVLQNDSLEHRRTNMRASEVMERFTQDTLKLHHDLQMEHKNAELQEIKTFATAASAIVLLVVMFFIMKTIQNRRRMETNKLRMMQLKMESVRNRISPHFVFNVLNNKIVHSGSKEADELMRLSKLIRANLDMSCRLDVSLAEELEFVKQYVEVERPLVDENMEFKLDVAPGIDLDKVRIPSMFVQILVENALVHGLRGWEGCKRLQVKIERKQQGMTSISVIDNGPGFDIRSAGRKRTGLTVLSQTIAMINERNRSKMSFFIHNLHDDGDKVLGCESGFLVPDKMKLSI